MGETGPWPSQASGLLGQREVNRSLQWCMQSARGIGEAFWGVRGTKSPGDTGPSQGGRWLGHLLKQEEQEAVGKTDSPV